MATANNSEMNTEENVNKSIPDVKEALNEYFKLKQGYETQNMNNKKQIINNTTLSNREKRSEFLKLKPKCINCKRPGGSKFQTTYIRGNETDEGYRQYSATCGIIADPCNFNIKIHVGEMELLPARLNTIQKDIQDAKNKVIDYKNKLLFGYLPTEQVLEEFDDLKDTISFYTSLYEAYFDNYNLIVDNDAKKADLEESITNSYIQINEIKDCIKKMNETDNAQYARDAVNIYVNTLVPLMNKIRTLKYNENMVWYDNATNTCSLIQNKQSIQSLIYSSFQHKVVDYNVGLEVEKKKTNKPKFIIESSSSSSSSSLAPSEKEEGKFVMKPLEKVGETNKEEVETIL